MGDLGSGALGIGDGGEGFEGVAQDVEAGCRRDGRRHGARVFGIDNGEVGFEIAVCNAGFDVAVGEVHNGYARGFASRAGCGGNGKEGFDGAGNGFALADGRVDIGEEVVGMGCK